MQKKLKGNNMSKADKDKPQTPAEKSRRLFKNLMIIILSAAFGSSVQIFVMIPNGMTSGGMPGIARIITHFAPSISYPVVYYTLSMIVLVAAYLTMGRTEAEKIIALAFAYPIMMFLFEKTGYELLDSPDPFLAAILLGIFYGIATGIGYMGGYSSGGTDTVARIIKFKLLNHVKVADIQMVMDVFIIIVSAFVFNTNVAIYAIVTAYVAAKVISAVMVGISGQFVQFDILSSDADEIADYIMHDVGRAVTSHISRGEYTGAERKSLTVVCTPSESVKIKKFVAEKDPQAFATITHISTVWGMDDGFRDIREVENT